MRKLMDRLAGGNKQASAQARYDVRNIGLPVPTGHTDQHHGKMDISQALVQTHDTPMMTGMSSQMPTGQNINVVTNHNIHLDRNEWLFRGIVGGMGKIAAYPFQLVGNIITGIAMGILGLLKIAAIIILIPTLIWAGILLQEKLSQEESVEGATETIMEQAGSAATGIGNAMSSDDEVDGESATR